MVRGTHDARSKDVRSADARPKAMVFGRDVRLWIAVIVAVVLIGVFVLPWLVPIHGAVLVSDSQAIGFSNRAAMLSMAAGTVAMFFLARRARASGGGGRRLLFSLDSVPADERVSARLMVWSIVLTLVAVAIFGALLRDRPIGDAAYFVDRILRVVAGGMPFSQIEFSYGPLLIYTPVALWRLLEWTGLNIYAVYYIWLGIGYTIGLLVNSYLLNRIHVTRTTRNAAFAVLAAMPLLIPTLGINYSSPRFLISYTLFIWVIGRLVASPGGLATSALPLLAAALGVSVSPEMGVALFAALTVTLSLLIIRGERAHLGALAVMLAGAALGGIGLVLAGPGTLAAFMSGAFYFPVLPGLPALIFVGTMLLLAWGVGITNDSPSTSTWTLHAGWLALAIVLILPALGRADFRHLFWNGLGAGLVCMAIAARDWRRADRYMSAVAAVFLVASLINTAVYYLPTLVERGLQTINASRETTVRAALSLRQSPIVWEQDWEQQEAVKQNGPYLAQRIAALPSPGYIELLQGDVGMQLAASGRLATWYGGVILTEADFRKSAQQLDAAETLILPTATFGAYRAAGVGAHVDSSGVAMVVPSTVGGRTLYGVLQWLPVTFRGRHQVLDPVASLGVVLVNDWVSYGEIGEYTVLGRR